MFLSELLLETGEEADYFVSSYCMTLLYLKKKLQSMLLTPRKMSLE